MSQGVTPHVKEVGDVDGRRWGLPILFSGVAGQGEILHGLTLEHPTPDHQLLDVRIVIFGAWNRVMLKFHYGVAQPNCHTLRDHKRKCLSSNIT
jgi:hypothetical protein